MSEPIKNTIELKTEQGDTFMFSTESSANYNLALVIIQHSKLLDLIIKQFVCSGSKMQETLEKVSNYMSKDCPDIKHEETK